jgi:hypothetical protein
VTVLTSWRRHSPFLALSILPALLWFAPVLRDPGHTVLGWEGDNLFFIRQFWWVKHSLLDLHQSPWVDPNSYWPYGYGVTRGELTLSNTLVALPLTAIFGPVPAYNVMLLSGFVLTAWASYAWAYRLTGSRAAALVAAIIAEIAPYRLARAPGHLNVITTQWFSCALWTFEELLRAGVAGRARHANRWAAALSISLALGALSSWYSAYQLVLMFPLYVAMRVRWTADTWSVKGLLKALAIAAVIATAVVLPAAIPYLRAAAHGEVTRQFVEANYWSLNFYDFFIPNANHPLLNSRMTKWFPKETLEWAGRGVSLGYVAMALAAYGVYRTHLKQNREILALVILLVVSASLGLGPILHSGDRAILVPAPYPVTKTVDWLFYHLRPGSRYRAELWAAQATWIPLPTLFLWVFVPVTSGMRAMSRFGYWTVLMTAGLAAFGARDLLSRLAREKRRQAVVVMVLVFAIAFESWSIRTVTRWEPRPVDLWVASRPSDDVVIELPIVDALRAGQDYYVTIQQHKTILGPRGDSFQPAILEERARVLQQMPSDHGIAALRSWGATLVIVHTAWAERWPEWQSTFERNHAVEAARFGETRVYRLR